MFTKWRQWYICQNFVLFCFVLWPHKLYILCETATLIKIHINKKHCFYTPCNKGVYKASSKLLLHAQYFVVNRGHPGNFCRILVKITWMKYIVCCIRFAIEQNSANNGPQSKTFRSVHPYRRSGKLHSALNHESLHR